MNDKILLHGARFQTRVGVPPEERAHPQEVVVDLAISFDIRAAAAADDFHQTIDYAAVRDTLARVASAKPRSLIETLAEEMAAAVLHEFNAGEVHLVLKKPAALRGAGVDAPGVEITRRRHA
jgi:dihydroneopterin aldolase